MEIEMKVGNHIENNMEMRWKLEIIWKYGKCVGTLVGFN